MKSTCFRRSAQLARGVQSLSFAHGGDRAKELTMNTPRISLPTLLLLAVALVAVPLTSPASAIENEAIQGTIVSAAEGQVAFVDSVGAQRILTTTPDCSVLIDGRRAVIGDLQSGMGAMLLVNRNMQCMQILATTQVGAPVPY
jgi:hypothetical protein